MKSFTYTLSWVGLMGILGSQTMALLNQPNNILWPSFILLSALLPIRGFMQNTRYTFQWTGFLSLFFLAIGVSGFFEDTHTNSSSFILLCSSIILYFGVVFHAKKLAYYEAIEKAKSQ